jgi:hypothetical protein
LLKLLHYNSDAEESQEKKSGFAGLWSKIKSPFKGKKEGK